MKMILALCLLFISNALAEKDQTYNSEGQKFSVEEVVKRDEVIWGLDFLPDARLIFTERTGNMFVYDEAGKKLTKIAGVPKVYDEGQGGLLDVRVHPDFSKNNLIFFTYSEPIGELATTTMARAELNDGKLQNVKKLFSAKSPNDNDMHFGSRIELDGKNHVFVTVGDRNERPAVQDLNSHIGKTIRLQEDGSVPKDNPFLGKKNALPEIYSLGHRSPQGLSFHPQTGELWESEMGPQGGDEVNVLKAGENYGWPVVTYGEEYGGGKVGKGKTMPGMQEPVVYWVPSISPSGMTFYSGKAFPRWEGNLFLANLSGQHLRRLALEGRRVVKQEELLKDKEWRFRQVRQGPQGYLYFTTDAGVIGRIRPVISSH